MQIHKTILQTHMNIMQIQMKTIAQWDMPGAGPLCKSTQNPLHNLGMGNYACFKACSEIQLIKI